MQIRHLVVLLAGLLPPLGAQIGFSQLTAAGPARTEHGLAYDQGRDRVVLFGGGSGGATLNDTWELSGTTWVQRTPATRPPARTRPAMAYDAARGRVVMFGGFASGGAMLGDTWLWDGNNWTAGPAAGPSPRAGAAMAYDSDRQVVVLYGGWVPSGQDDNQTWEWNGTGWTQRLVAVRPPPRGAHRMAYDAARQRTVLFGGWSTPGNGTLGDTWTWDGNLWQQQLVPGPSNRCDPSFAYDPRRRRLVSFGGLLRFVGGTPVMSNETWEWDGGSWTLRPANGTPSRRAYSEMVFDRGRRSLVLHGGNDPSATFSNTWSLNVANPASVDPFGSGCAGSAGVPALSEVEMQLPWIGDRFEVLLDGAPANASIAFAVWGLSNTIWNGQPLPADLTALGLPGCQAFISLDVTTVVLLAAGAGTAGGPIPNSPALVGGAFYAQAMVLDPGVMRPVPGAVTNAVSIVLGAR